jgi:O-antigen ligase
LSIFLVCIMASGSWALEPHESLFADLTGILAMLLQVPLTIATLASLRSRITNVNRLLWALLLGSIPGCIRTIQNALAGVRYLEDQSAQDQNQYYMGFIAPDIFSTILLMGGIFLIFWLLSSAASATRKVLAGAILPLLCVALLLTGIRSSWIALGLPTLVLLVRTRSFFALFGGFLMIAMIGFLAFSSVIGLNMNEKMAARLSERSLGSGETRLRYWQVGLQGFAKRPILGIGWGCYPSFAADNTVGRRAATHNIFIRMVCELGLVGLVLFCAWILRTLQILRGSPAAALTRLIMLGVLVQGLFLDHFLSSHFWLFIGLCEGVAAAHLLGERERFEAQNEVPVPRGVRLAA